MSISAIRVVSEIGVEFIWVSKPFSTLEQATNANKIKDIIKNGNNFIYLCYLSPKRIIEVTEARVVIRTTIKETTKNIIDIKA